MTTNLDTSYVALQTERIQLNANAARGWLAEKERGTVSRPSVVVRARRYSGSTLVSLGERLQGTTAPAAASLAMKTSR